VVVAGPGRSGRAGRVLSAASVLIALLIIVPIASLLLSIAAPGTETWRHLAETVLTGYIVNTAVLAVGVGAGVFVLGTGTAWVVTMCRFPGRRVFEWALLLPLAMPAYVIAYAYTDLLQFTGPVQGALRELTGWGPREYWFPPIRSLGGAVAMLVFVLYPYVYLLARAAFLEQSVCILEVSRTLGSTPWQSFRRVAIPAARPALIAGTALALMETLADYGTVAFFGVQTFTTGIVRAWTSFGDRTAAAQLSSALLCFVFVVLVLERTSRAKARFHHTSVRYRHLPSRRLAGARAAAAFIACAVPVMLGFLLPAAVLIDQARAVVDRELVARAAELAGNSFTLGGVTAMLAVALAVVMAYAARISASPLTRTANRIASMGYAIPGTVLAVGVLAPIALADRALNTAVEATFGVSSGLVLAGSLVTLIFAYLVRFLAVSIHIVEASLAKINPRTDDAARTLGQSAPKTLVRVHIPLMRASLLTAALLVFVDVVKELPATLLLRPFNFDTLAVQAYNFASDERLAEASVPSLMIVAVGILPVVLLSRTIAEARPGAGAKPVRRLTSLLRPAPRGSTVQEETNPRPDPS